MSEKKVGIKETKEFLNGIEELAKAGAKIAEDRKISADDLMVLVALGSNMGVLADAFKGIAKMKDEIKDLDRNELVEIVKELYDIADHIVDAVKGE